MDHRDKPDSYVFDLEKTMTFQAEKIVELQKQNGNLGNQLGKERERHRQTMIDKSSANYHLRKLAKFTDEMLSIASQGCDADGETIQEVALSCGLIKQVKAEKAYGEACSCVEFGFPIECYRKKYGDRK